MHMQCSSTAVGKQQRSHGGFQFRNGVLHRPTGGRLITHGLTHRLMSASLLSRYTDSAGDPQARAFVKSAVGMGGNEAACTVTFADAAASEAATDAAGAPATDVNATNREDRMAMCWCRCCFEQATGSPAASQESP